MKLYPFPEQKLTKIGIYVLFLGALLFNRDALYPHAILGFYKSQFLMLGVMASGGIAFLVCRRGDWKALSTDRRTWFALASGVVIVLPMVCKGDWQLMYLSIYLCVLFGIFLSLIMTLEDGAKIYLNILCALSLFSLVCAYGFRFLPDGGMPGIPVVRIDTGVDFYFFGASFVPLTYVKYRNFGIFREPGVYQYFLLLGLFLNNYEVQWNSGKKLWTVNILLAVTMVSTFATGGLIELALLAAVLFFDKGWYRKKAGKLAALAVFLLGAGAAVYVLLRKGPLYETLVDMLSKFDMNSESMTDRAGSIIENTKTFLHHPLLGGGVREALYAVANNTSSSTLMYAILGILGGTLNAAAWVLLTWRKEGKLWVSLSLTVILFMSFNTENLITNPYFWLFPVMAVAERGLPLLKCPKKERR